MKKNEFLSYLKELDIELTEKQLNQFEQFYMILVEENKKMNLTGITEKEEVYLKHFYDSLTIKSMIDNIEEIDSLCDVGGGAGFPSIPIKIAFPNLKIVVVDSLEKRINFLKKVINELQLKNIEPIHARAEDFANDNREKFDIVTARAVARLNILSELCLPLTKVNGYFIPLKGNSGSLEYEEAKKGISILGGKLLHKHEFNLPFEESNRVILKIKKIKNTHKKYPRNYSQIKKKPL